jgi:uncharacterized protein (UPF0276 family)
MTTPAPSLGAGVGLKFEHVHEALAARSPGLWFEVHAENAMVEGGPRLAALDAIAERHPLSMHGVSLSLAGMAPPDRATLAAWSRLVRRLRPALVSEHLAWSRAGPAVLPDLLPFPRTTAALVRLVDHVSQVQEAIGRAIAIENPSHYLALDGHAWDEIEFLATLCARSGCRLLLDVNNVHVGAHNLGTDAGAWIDAVPAALVDEVHVAGHRQDPVHGPRLLVDSHDAPVTEAVWALLDRFLARAGPRPVLLERDAELPAFDVLMAERARAADAIERSAAGAVARTGEGRSDCHRGSRQVARVSPAAAAGAVDEAAFQRDFAAALLGGEGTEPAHPLAAQPGFAVYRNTVARGLVDALAANFPTVRSLLGDDAFRAVARDHAVAEPPREAALAGYGADFPTALARWLDREGVLDELPYLEDVARLDRLWTESHLAADAEPLRLADLGGFEPDALLALRLAPHPALRRFASGETPAFTIWRRHREGGDPGAPLDWQPEAALLVRPGSHVCWHLLSLHALLMIDSLVSGETVGQALAALDEPGDGADETAAPDVALLAGWIEAGAFRRQPPP